MSFAGEMLGATRSDGLVHVDVELVRAAQEGRTPGAPEFFIMEPGHDRSDYLMGAAIVVWLCGAGAYV